MSIIFYLYLIILGISGFFLGLQLHKLWGFDLKISVIVSGLILLGLGELIQWQYKRYKTQANPEAPLLSATRPFDLHEDDYGQWEILPEENFEFVLSELGVIQDFSDSHRVEGGFGYTDVYRRQVEPISLEEKSLSKELLDDLFSEHFPAFDAISNEWVLDYDVRGQLWSVFGNTNYVSVFYTASPETRHVTKLILVLHPQNAEDSRDMQLLFSLLQEIEGLLFVSWEESEAFLLSNTDEINTYIEDHGFFEDETSEPF